MMDGIGSLYMKLAVAFTMKLTWQLAFCLIRRLHLSSVATTGKPGEPASEEVTKVFSVAFKKTLTETVFKNLSTKVTVLGNCKFAQAKLVNLVVFASVSLSIRSSDIKLQQVQRNMSKMTGCFIKLLSELPNILKTNGDHKDEKLEVIQIILDGIKMSGHADQNLVAIRKKFHYLVLAVNRRIWQNLLTTPNLIFLGRN